MGHVFRFLREKGVIVSKKNDQIIVGAFIRFLGNAEELGHGGWAWGMKMLEKRSSGDADPVNKEDACELTRSQHYERYRRCKLERRASRTAVGYQYAALPPVGGTEAKRTKFLGELQRKEEEVRQLFVSKEKETELELKEKERGVHEESSDLEPVHQEETQEVEGKRQELEEEAAAFSPKAQRGPAGSGRMPCCRSS